MNGWFRLTAAVCAGLFFGFLRADAALPAATPESQGVSSQAILRWIEACEATAATNGFGGGYLHGFVIARHGKAIAEGSWAPQDTLREPHMLYSLSKSFTSVAIGFLVDAGGRLAVTWQMLGGVRHGFFVVELDPDGTQK